MASSEKEGGTFLLMTALSSLHDPSIVQLSFWSLGGVSDVGFCVPDELLRV
jgi:hypothetical protein